MRLSNTVLLCLFSVSLYAQEKEGGFDGHKWEAPYVLATPKDWGIERFLIPISFAPEISYKGVEDIRFTPGWAKAKSEEYWSYAFLWYLDGEVIYDLKRIDLSDLNTEVKINSKRIEQNLKAYYTGLVSTNGSSIPADKVIPVVTSFKAKKKENGDASTYVGTIFMTDYMTQKPITLNGKVHVKSCPGSNKTLIFYELSPQPLTHTIWSRLDQLWLDFECEKK